MGIGDWGLGIGDWGLGIGPNPQFIFLMYVFIRFQEESLKNELSLGKSIRKRLFLRKRSNKN